jgi:hypothetical protein
MRWPSRSRVVFTFLLLFGCVRESDIGTEVTESGYKGDKCWLDSDGRLSSFLLIFRQANTITPYLISAKCVIKGQGEEYALSTLSHLTDLTIVDSSRAFQKYFPGFMISASLRTELGIPSSDSEIYFVSFSFKRYHTSSVAVVAPSRVFALVDTKVDFERFLGLSPKSRLELARKVRAGWAVSSPR